jgi:hypothetical protein
MPRLTCRVDIGDVVDRVVELLLGLVEVAGGDPVETDPDHVQVDVVVLDVPDLLEQRYPGGDRRLGIGRHPLAGEAEDVEEDRQAGTGVDAETACDRLDAGHAR